MIGILLMSHGNMAEGMLNSAELFFGKDIENLKALCLSENDSPEEFDEKIRESIEELNTGDGIIVMCDLFGGTPCNRMVGFLEDDIQVISGMNFTMLLELLGRRLSNENIRELDVDSLIETGRTGIINLNQYINDTDDDDEESL